MYVIKVPLGVRSYTISIGNKLLARLGQECKRLYLGQHCAVITDRNVAPRYSEGVLQSLKTSGFEPTLITVPAGETAKSLKVAAAWSVTSPASLPQLIRAALILSKSRQRCWRRWTVRSVAKSGSI